MIEKLLKPNNTLPAGLDVIRVISGGIIFSFGLEIFNSEQTGGYIEWLTSVGMPLADIMAYIGKFSELVFGLFLTVGFLTRISTIPLMITMCVVNFIMLDGSPRSQPFYLLLIFASFFFSGSGRISIDYLIGKRRSGTPQ